MLEELRRRTGPLGLEIILVNVWEGVDARAEAGQFCQMWGVDGTVLIDEAGDYARRLGVRGVPTNVLVGADGVVQEVGAVTPVELHAAAERLLGRPLPASAVQ